MTSEAESKMVSRRRILPFFGLAAAAGLALRYTAAEAQTNGMERRGERRDTRQGCRQANGAVGADKRGCKQQGRQNSAPTPAQPVQK